jgi:hypothetical protein
VAFKSNEPSYGLCQLWELSLVVDGLINKVYHFYKGPSDRIRVIGTAGTIASTFYLIRDLVNDTDTLPLLPQQYGRLQQLVSTMGTRLICAMGGKKFYPVEERIFLSANIPSAEATMTSIATYTPRQLII